MKRRFAMRFFSKVVCPFVLLYCSACAIEAAGAVTMEAHGTSTGMGSMEAGTGFAGAAIESARYSMTLDTAGQHFDTDFTEVGLVLADTFNQNFRMGLEGGYLRLQQTQNTLTAGTDLTGQYYGIRATASVWVARNTSLEATAKYSYRDAKGSNQAQSVELRWYEGWAEAGPVWHAGRWRLRAGGYYQHLDGDEFDTGTVTASRTFKSADAAGAFAGVDYFVDRTGYIGFRLFGGARAGARVVFARNF